MTRELTKNEFESTFTSRMLDVSDIAEPVIDIWPYVEQLSNNNLIPQNVFTENMVECVYRTLDYTTEHVLLPSHIPGQLVVIVINRNNPEISGHYILHSREDYYN